MHLDGSTPGRALIDPRHGATLPKTGEQPPAWRRSAAAGDSSPFSKRARPRSVSRARCSPDPRTDGAQAARGRRSDRLLQPALADQHRATLQAQQRQVMNRSRRRPETWRSRRPSHPGRRGSRPEAWASARPPRGPHGARRRGGPRRWTEDAGRSSSSPAANPAPAAMARLGGRPSARPDRRRAGRPPAPLGIRPGQEMAAPAPDAACRISDAFLHVVRHHRMLESSSRPPCRRFTVDNGDPSGGYL